MSKGRSISLAAAVATLVIGIVGVALLLDRGSGTSTAAAGTGVPNSGVAGGRPGFDSSAMNAFRQCLADKGVTLPAPGQGGPGSLTDAQRQAFEACRSKLPQRPDGDGGGGHGFAPVPGIRPDDDQGEDSGTTRKGTV